jgi:hypothetical protein
MFHGGASHIAQEKRALSPLALAFIPHAGAKAFRQLRWPYFGDCSASGFGSGRKSRFIPSGKQDQYRATIMIATITNAAISERARSSVFDPGFAISSSGGMVYVGDCNSPTSQPTSPDFIGSDAMAIFST